MLMHTRNKTYFQMGCVTCSLCHSQDTNKSTCLFNPNPLKHPLAHVKPAPQPTQNGTKWVKGTSSNSETRFI